MTTQTIQAYAEIETFIDTHGLSNVLDFISTVCAEKAEHLRSNWQDASEAKAWTKASNEVDVVQGKVSRLGL